MRPDRFRTLPGPPDVGLSERSAELDPEDASSCREIERREDLVRQAGGMLSAEAAGQLCTIGRQAVDKRRGTKRCSPSVKRRDWFYPRAQFHEHEVIRHARDREGFERPPLGDARFIVTGDACSTA